jgi:predicted RNA binding protein YcfA (HicA-like mRNA interferase family)
MSSLTPRPMSLSEVERWLRDLGYEFQKTNASHRIYYNREIGHRLPIKCYNRRKAQITRAQIEGTVREIRAAQRLHAERRTA